MPYGPCKAAQLQHVKELSQLLGPKCIRVNAISPGPIIAKDGPWGQMAKEVPDWVEKQRLKVPLKRYGVLQEIANVTVFLASPLSSFVSGMNWLMVASTLGLSSNSMRFSSPIGPMECRVFYLIACLQSHV